MTIWIAFERGDHECWNTFERDEHEYWKAFDQEEHGNWNTFKNERLLTELEMEIDSTNKKVESPKTDMKTQTGRLMVAVIVVPVVITLAHWLIAAVSGRYCWGSESVDRNANQTTKGHQTQQVKQKSRVTNDTSTNWERTPFKGTVAIDY